MLRVLVLVLMCAVLAACAGPPRLAAADRSGVWGYLRLVPRDDLVGGGTPGAAGAGPAYADRRYAHAELVDYTRPGFAVVYLEGPAASGEALALTIRSRLGGVRIEPRHGVLPVRGEILVRNATQEARVLTCPAAGLVRRLAPGEQVAFPAPHPGLLELFLPGSAEQAGRAQVFAAPGPYAQVDGAGRYEIVEVEAGRRRVHAWHPRFPPAMRDVELEPGSVVRVDLELGVGLDGESLHGN